MSNNSLLRRLQSSHAEHTSPSHECQSLTQSHQSQSPTHHRTSSEDPRPPFTPSATNPLRSSAARRRSDSRPPSHTPVSIQIMGSQLLPCRTPNASSSNPASRLTSPGRASAVPSGSQISLEDEQEAYLASLAQHRHLADERRCRKQRARTESTQRDAEMANRQATKRAEKERREKVCVFQIL